MSIRPIITATVLARQSRKQQILALAAVSALFGNAQAADIFKLDNADALNVNTAWVDGANAPALPGSSDIAVWDSRIAGPLTSDLGASTTWAGLRILSPGGLVTINGAFTLTLGSSGIDMSSATQDLTIGATVGTLQDQKQTWNVPTGRTLTITPALSRGARSTVDFTGGGDVVLNGNTATSTPAWATVNGRTDIASLNASKVVKGATTVFTFFKPNGGNASGTQPGLDVTQPTTFGATQAYRHSNSLTTTNGIRFNEDNGGASLWTVDTSTSGRLGTTPVILITPNVTQDIQYNGSGGVRPPSTSAELVINHNGSGNLIFNTTMNNFTGATSPILKLGPGQLTVASNSGISGQTSVMEGTLQLGNGGATGSLAAGTILLNNTTLNFNRSDTAGAYAGVIAGTGVLNFISPSTGACALTGTASTFTGPVNVTGGGLIIANIANIPATATLNLNNGSIVHAASSAADISARTVTLVGNATIDTGANAVTYANGIGGGGSGGLTKVGTGILTLAGNNTYTGNTTVAAGTLRISNASGSHPGNVQVNANATIGGTGTISGTTTVLQDAILAPGASVGTLHTGSLDLQGGSKANWEFATGSYDKVVVDQANGLTLNGGAFTLLNENTADPFSTVGNYDLIQYSGSVNGGTNSLSVTNPQPGKNYAFSLTGGFVRLSITSAGVVSQWITDGSGSFGVAGNWSPATVPDTVGATANFTTNLSSPATVTLDGSRTVGALVFQSSPNGYTIAQGTGGTLNLNNGTALGAISVLSGNHTISAPVALAGNSQVSTVTGSSITLTNTISGSANISKNGPGTLVMSGSNSFSGGVFLNDGTVAIGHNNALGSGQAIMSTTGSLRADADVVVPNQFITNSGLTGVIDTQGFTMQLNGDINGGGPVIKNGTGTLIINGNSFGAGNTVNAGTLQFGTGGTTGDTNGNITNNGVVVYNRSDDFTFGNVMSGTGSFIKKAANTITLSNANTYSGETQIHGGTLVIGTDLAMQSSTLDYNNYGGNFSFGNQTTPTLGGLKGAQNLDLTNASAAPVTLSVGNNGQNTTYSGVLSGAGSSINKIGSGTLTLTGVNTFDAPALVSSGVLEIGPGGAISGVSASVAVGGGSAKMLVSGGTLNLSGILELGNANSGIQVTAGTVSAAGVNANYPSNASQNHYLRIDGGVVNIGTYAAGRNGGSLSSVTEPTAGVNTYGIYVTGGTLNVSGSLGIGVATLANSNDSFVMDNGYVNVDGPISVSLNNTGRWSVIDINGGTFISNDVTQGILLGGATTHAGGNNLLLVRNGVATVERVQFGSGSYNGGTATAGFVTNGAVSLRGGTLYMGSGGIVKGTTGEYLTAIRLASGTLGAKADWSSNQPVLMDNTAGTMYVKAADAAGAAHNITLSGIASGTGGFNKTGAGTLILSGANTYTGNTTVSGGTLVLAPAAANIVVTGAAGAVLNGGKLVIDYTGGSSPKATLVDHATLGLAANAAGGHIAGQLRTSTTDATKAIGWLDDGSSTFQASYTYKGDTNLTGTVDSTDFNALVALGNYGMTSGAIWANGDFDYNGKVNSIDFNDLAGNFGAAALPAPVPGAGLGSVVPEPSTLGLIGIAAMGLISRRRRD